MQISAREVMGLPVFAQAEKQRLARVLDLIVLPENGKVVALLVSAGFWGKPKLVDRKSVV